jgi:hypothetical protein
LANDYVVLGINADSNTNGGISVDYDYNRFTLGNTDDEIILSNSNTILDQIAWDNGATFPNPTGASMNLDPNKYDDIDNDDGSNWCESGSVLASGDFGTPGATNDACQQNTITYTTNIVPILQSYNCTACHSNQLSNLATLLTVQSGDYSTLNRNANMPWITAGDANSSYLFLKISGIAPYGGSMPQGGGVVSINDLQTIESWINNGAQ